VETFAAIGVPQGPVTGGGLICPNSPVGTHCLTRNTVRGPPSSALQLPSCAALLRIARHHAGLRGNDLESRRRIDCDRRHNLGCMATMGFHNPLVADIRRKTTAYVRRLRNPFPDRVSAGRPHSLCPHPSIQRATVASGNGGVDSLLQAGLTLGAISELVGRSGRTALALSVAAAVTHAGKLPPEPTCPTHLILSLWLQQASWADPRGFGLCLSPARETRTAGLASFLHARDSFRVEPNPRTSAETQPKVVSTSQ